MRTSTKRYLWGLTMVLLGGASMADSVSYGVGSLPISAFVFGLGFVLIVWSYIND